MDENTLSMAEKMNQLYQEREEQYKKREKLFDDRSKQLQSLANALEKQKNSQEQKATDLDNREKELDQIQDALAAKVEDMEKQETALKNWEQETKESLAKAKQEQENELIKKRQELQMEKLQAQNLSIELQAERDNLKMMQENLKLYPDMSLPTDKETELQAKIETLQSRLSMAEKERDSKTEQMEKLQKDFDAKEDELANLQLKAEDSSTDPEVEEKLRKRNGELQGKVIELNKQVKSLQRDLDDQAKDKEELQRQLEENSNQPESHDLSAEELQNYLLTLPEFENVTTRHNTDGIIVDAVCGEKNYHFRFDSLPCYEISVPRRETKNLKEVIYQMNAEMPEYKASYDEYEKAAVLTGWYEFRQRSW
jgi:chromosome segregation ATPase